MGGMAQYIFTIRKQHSVNKVHTLRYSVSKISEYFRGVVFFYYFVIYCAANHGIWCSDRGKSSLSPTPPIYLVTCP